MRCTQATLEALGIYGKCPLTGLGVIEAIQDSGKKYSLRLQQVTVGYALKHLDKGSYYLSGCGHAMALVNGVLTDTAEGGVKRKVDVIEILGK